MDQGKEPAQPKWQLMVSLAFFLQLTVNERKNSREEWLGVSAGRGDTTINLALGRPKQDIVRELEASLGYINKFMASLCYIVKLSKKKPKKQKKPHPF